MKKTFPIILSSILAITVTSSVAHAETMYTNILLQNNQPSFPLVGITPTSTTAATTAKTTTPAKKAVQTTEHKLTWTGTYGKQPLSIKSVQETLKKYKQLPTQKPWNFAGKMVSDAKPIILECVNQYGKNLTVGAFAHCCGTGRTTLAPVQETYGRLTYDPKACQEMIETVIKIHNDSVKILATCMPENDTLATAGHYVWVNGVKKCASTDCKKGSYLVTDANGKSQGWCKQENDPNAQPAENATPVVTPEQAETPVVTPEQVETPVVTPEQAETPVVAPEQVETPVVTPEQVETPVVTPEQAETPVVAPEQVETPVVTPEQVETPVVTPEQVETPVVTSEETATTADKIENTETTLSEKVQNQIKKNENENICLSMGVKSAEMNECKKDPDTYKKNKDACDSITGLSAVEVNQCMKDPKAFAQKHVDEAACESLGLKKGTADFAECKKDPDTYKTNKEACDSITGLSAVEINQCMKDPKAFAQKRVNKANEENKKKELEGKCDALGAKSGANKKLCMEDPDKYSNAKSQCESMEATGTNFNKCVTDPAEYKKTYELEKAAKEKGMNVRQYEKYMEEQEQLEAMRKLLG